MSASPREQALAHIRESLDTEAGQRLLVALQYVGGIVPAVLEELRAGAVPEKTIVDRILSVPPAPEPAYARPRPRPQPRSARPRPPGGSRTPAQVTTGGAFADWVNGKRPWGPEVMGWADDDARAPGMYAATAGERLRRGHDDD